MLLYVLALLTCLGMFKKALQTVTCLLLASPLNAFDVSLDGVEFGVLQRAITENSWDANSPLLSDPLVLNEGDVLKVLRWDYASNSSGNNYQSVEPFIYATHGSILSKADESDYIVGPATIQIGFVFGDLDSSGIVVSDSVVVSVPNQPSARTGNTTAEEYVYEPATLSQTGRNYAQMDYAILRKGAATQSSYLTVPSSPSGNFEVKLQTSTDLQTWTPTTSGIFNYGDNTRFFRLVVE